MTRKELITACVEEQIKRGIVKPEGKELQIRARLKGMGGIKPMSKVECESWYRKVFEA